MTKESGYYLEFEIDGNGITIRPTVEAIEEKERFLSLPQHEAEWELLEDYLCNGWDRILPEENGSLTDAMMISWDVKRDEFALFVSSGTVYSDINYYQIRSWVEDLFVNGSARLDAFPSEDAA